MFAFNMIINFSVKFLNFIVMSEKSKKNWSIVLKVLQYVVAVLLGAVGGASM